MVTGCSATTEGLISVVVVALLATGCCSFFTVVS